MGPRNLIDVDEALASEPTRLLIPLQTPTSGELEVTFKAHRATTPGKTLEVQLPRPVADLPGPAEIVVLPDDNVELTPRSEAFVGLIRQSATPTMKLPERQEEPLVYRGDAQLAKFVAERRCTRSRSRCRSAAGFKLVIKQHASSNGCPIALPTSRSTASRSRCSRGIATAGRLEVLVDGQKLSSIGQPEEVQRDGLSAHVTFALGRQRIGRLEAVVRYPVSQPRTTTAPNSELTVGLVMPMDAELTGNELTVTAEPGMRIEPRGEAWMATDDGNDAAECDRPPMADRLRVQLAAKTAIPVAEFTLQLDNCAGRQLDDHRATLDPNLAQRRPAAGSCDATSEQFRAARAIETSCGHSSQRDGGSA